MSILGINGIHVDPIDGFKLALFIARAVMVLGLVVWGVSSALLLRTLWRVLTAQSPSRARQALRFAIGLGVLYCSVASGYLALLVRSWWLTAVEGVPKNLMLSRKYVSLAWGADFAFYGAGILFCIGVLMLMALRDEKSGQIREYSDVSN